MTTLLAAVAASLIAQDPVPVPDPPPETEKLVIEDISEQAHAGDLVALAAARAWLVAAQRENGSWSDGDTGVHDVGISGLALLALLQTPSQAADDALRRTLSLAVGYLLEEQDDASGLVGSQVGHAFLYSHAIAAWSLAEARRSGLVDPDPELNAAVNAAALFSMRSRNPYGAWRYDAPPVGDNDTSVTAWMVHGLISAQAVGITPPAPDANGKSPWWSTIEAVRSGAVNWVQEVTDQETGRIGYDRRGSRSSRVTGVNDRSDVTRNEAMTAAGLCILEQCGDIDEQLIERQVNLIASLPPASAAQGGVIDHYAWFWGTRALGARGGDVWDAWRKALTDTLLPLQDKTGEDAGSWGPDGVWAYAGGRVYTTSMSILSLQRCVE